MVATVFATALLLAATSAEALLAELQRAIARDDRQAVAALIRYPITVATMGVRIPIRDAAALVQSYEAVFTPELKAAIADRSAVRSGLIQIVPVEGVFKVSELRPPVTGRAAPAASAATAKPQAGPRRLTFAAVQQIAQFSGTV